MKFDNSLFRRHVAIALVVVLGSVSILAPLADAADGPPSPDAQPSPEAVLSDPSATSTIPSLPAGATRAEVQTQIDILNASHEEVAARINELNGQIVSAAEASTSANAAAAEAAEAAQRAAARAEKAVVELQAARDVARDYAVETYVRPAPAEERVLSISRAGDAGYARDVLKIISEKRYEIAELIAVKKRNAEREQERADTLAGEAAATATEAAQKLNDLQSVMAQQQQLATEVDERLNDALAEAASLAEIDRQHAMELAAREMALSSALGAPASGLPAGALPAAPVGSSEIVRAGGLRVHVSIAANVEAMVQAAREAGINLGGGGYRDPQGQINTRIANCGSTPYDIYEKPASACSPPTALPGRSMHERGLALDLTADGSLISSRSNPAFIWLSENAATYGLRNLPSEPWHWSVNGR